MKKRQTILSVAVLCLLIAIAWGAYLYNKPHADAGSKLTDETMRADSLYASYAGDEAAADKRFMNKILEVKGTVQDITMNNSKPAVKLTTGQPGSINCQMAMDSSEVFAHIQKGMQVTIKGKCSGYLMDVNLVDCVLK